MIIDKSSKVTADIRLHFAWHTRFKTKILLKEVKADLHAFLLQKCAENGIKILGGNVSKDYVHLSLSCPPKLSCSHIAQVLKGSSAQYLRNTYPHLKGPPFGDSLWGRGYICLSFGDGGEVERLQAFIQGPIDEDE